MKTQSARTPAARFATSPALKPIALAVALALTSPHAVFAAPTGATVVAGQAQVTHPNAQTTLVKQGSDKAIINWRSFSIAAGQTVDFQQPNSGSVALNRVTTPTPSEIFGRLTANGKVFLVNPNGVLFGKGASVDVGGLVASTLNISDADFLAGRFSFSDGGGSAGAVRNDGTLAAAERGTIALLGAQVSNNGTITARLGTVGLAAGGKVSLDFNGDGLTRIVVGAARINALVENGGAVISEGGQVIMTARAVAALADTVVRHDGIVQANSLVERNGRIVLDGGSAGKVEVAGTAEATGLGAGQRGGDVTVIGKDLILAGGSRIDVRGDAGGGAVLVGGDYQGGNPLIPHASSTTMASGATIRADALGNGNGGKVILWSENTSSVHGSVSARAGALSGDGGFVETSGRSVDDIGMRVNASSAKGKAGTWLVDPEDRTVDATLAASIAETLDNGTNYTLRTNDHDFEERGDINVNANIIKSAGGNVKLTLEADHDIIVAAGVQIASTSATGKLDVDFNANARGVANPEVTINDAFGVGAIVMKAGSSIKTNGGDIQFYGQSDPIKGFARGNTFNRAGIRLDQVTLDTRTGGADSGAGGKVSMRAIGDFDHDDEVADGAPGIIIADSSIFSSTGNINMTAWGGSGLGRTNTDGSITRSNGGIGVDLQLSGPAKLSTTSGSLTIYGEDGSAWNTDGPGSFGTYGVLATLYTGGSIESGTGIVDIAGVSDGIGGEGARFFLSNGHITAGGVKLWGVGRLGAGVRIDLVDSSVGSSNGDLAIIGTGGSSLGAGVAISSVQGDGGSDGSSGIGGIMTASRARLIADHGQITIDGSNNYSSNNDAPPDDVSGVALTGIALTTVQGDIRVQGSGISSSGIVPIGVSLRNVLASTATGAENLAPGNIYIEGRSGASAPGLLFDGVTLGGAAMTGDIILGARNAGPGPMIAYGATSSFRNAVQTAGIVNLRVSAGLDSDDPPETSIPIGVGGAATGFNVSFTALGIGRTGFSNVVVGSREHTAAISFLDPAPFLGNLTLQNDGAGSEGIVLSNVNVQGQFMLSTGGSVNAPDAAINASSLLLHGSQPESNFQLTNLANSVGAFAAKFDTNKRLGSPEYGDVNYINKGALAIGPMTGTGFSSVTNAATPIDAANTVVAGDLLVRASGNLTLGSNISTLDSAITLVTGGIFNNVSNSTLLPSGGDTWRVFADTWVGENRGGLTPPSPHPNYYNCAYGGPCGDAITGSHFIYRAQPLLTLQANQLARAYGDANPALTFTQSGLVNGDTFADVASGAYATSPGTSLAVGAYLINGTFTSPVGYAIDARPGALTVDRAALLISVDDKDKVYGGADPLFSATMTGFKYADTSAVVSGLTLSAPTGASATAGAHQIVAANGVADNYAISYRPGTLSVGKAPLIIAADNKAKVYGAPDPLLTATMSGFRYADTSAVVSGLTLTAPTGAAAVAGNLPIVPANAGASNYAPSYVPGVLAVAPAALTYVADGSMQFQDNPARPLTGTVTGFVYNDTLASATTGSLAFSAAATPLSPPGVYAVHGSGLAAANYSFIQARFNDTALTVLPSPIIARPTILRDVTFASSNVYEKNFGVPRLCVGTAPLGLAGADRNDALALEWSRVRVSPNLSNCLVLGQRNSCSDF